MIAPFDHKSRIPADLLGSRQESAVQSQPEKVAATVKQWVGSHPTAAVVTCAVLGFVVGYVVKRR